MKPEVFLKAAERVADNSYDMCCPAILAFSPWHSYEEHQAFFAELFRPRSRDNDECWWPFSQREPRVIALLLAYEVAKEAKP